MKHTRAYKPLAFPLPPKSMYVCIYFNMGLPCMLKPFMFLPSYYSVVFVNWKKVDKRGNIPEIISPPPSKKVQSATI